MKPILRGKILNFLFDIYPRDIEEISIMGVFYEYHKKNDIAQCLEYLVGKEYISREERPHPYKAQQKIRLYKITPEGVDLHDGLRSDPGVTVVPE